MFVFVIFCQKLFADHGSETKTSLNFIQNSETYFPYITVCSSNVYNMHALKGISILKELLLGRVRALKTEETYEIIHFNI